MHGTPLFAGAGVTLLFVGAGQPRHRFTEERERYSNLPLLHLFR